MKDELKLPIDVSNIIKEDVSKKSNLKPWPPAPKLMYFDRPHLLIEYLPGEPRQILKEVFAKFLRCETLKENLKEWLNEIDFVPTSDEDGHPELQWQREFYLSLTMLIQALNEVNNNPNVEFQVNSKMEVNAKNELEYYANQTWEIIHGFCEQYPIAYARRELWCLLNATVIHACDSPGSLVPAEILNWYEEVVSLVEAAYVLHNKTIGG